MFSNSADQSHPTIQRNQLGTIPYRFRVFYQNYGRENVTEIDRVRHIFAVGKKQKEKVDELSTLKEQERNQIALVKTRKAELDTLNQSFEQQKTAKAKVIKNAANYSNAYNKNAFYSAYSHRSDWREATPEEWRRARWCNGMDAAQACTEEKTILCGHWHCSYGHARYENKGSEFGPDADFSPYYGPGVIALDACTAYSRKINILTLED